MNNTVNDVFQDGKFRIEWLEELDKLPNEISELENNLKILEELDTSRFSIEDIHDLFHKHAILFVNHCETFEASIFNDMNVWRARKDINLSSEDITNPKTFSYPPLCSENGRGHLKEKPVFYAALNEATAILETKPKIGEKVFLGKWQINCTRNLKTRILLPTGIPESSILHGLSQKQDAQINEMTMSYGLSKAAQLKLISNFVGKCFVDGKPPYLLTSWIGNKILNDGINLDLYFYASALNKTKGLNMAIKPEFVDSFMTLKKVYEMEIREINGGNISTSLYEVGDNKNGNLIWREIEDSDLNILNLSQL